MVSGSIQLSLNPEVRHQEFNPLFGRFFQRKESLDNDGMLIRESGCLEIRADFGQECQALFHRDQLGLGMLDSAENIIMVGDQISEVPHRIFSDAGYGSGAGNRGQVLLRLFKLIEIDHAPAELVGGELLPAGAHLRQIVQIIGAGFLELCFVKEVLGDQKSDPSRTLGRGIQFQNL